MTSHFLFLADGLDRMNRHGAYVKSRRKLRMGQVRRKQ